MRTKSNLEIFCETIILTIGLVAVSFCFAELNRKYPEFVGYGFAEAQVTQNDLIGAKRITTIKYKNETFRLYGTLPEKLHVGDCVKIPARFFENYPTIIDIDSAGLCKN